MSSAVNDVVVTVIGMINDLHLFARMTRGALPIENGLSCEIGPSSPSGNFLDRTSLVPIDLTINGKHEDLQLLSETMNRIHSVLTTATEYPSGDGWQIVEINNGSLPSIISREPNNTWLMASSLSVMTHWTSN